MIFSRFHRFLARSPWGFGLVTMLAFAIYDVTPAWALKIAAGAPLTLANDVLDGPNLVTSSSSITDKGILVGSGGGRGISFVTPNGTSTRKFLVQSSANSGNPTLDQLVQGDLPAETSAQLATRLSDETGTGAACFANAPTLVSPVISTSIDLPANAVNAIGEIDSSIKSGNGSKLATVTGTLTNNNCVKIDSSGNLVDAGGTCGGGTTYSTKRFTTLSVVSGASGVTVYHDGASTMSTAETDVMLAPFSAATTITDVRCNTTPEVGSGNTITVTLQSGALTGSSLTASSLVATPSATVARNHGTPSSGTLAVSAGQGIDFKIVTTGSSIPDVRVGCSWRETNAA